MVFASFDTSIGACAVAVVPFSSATTLDSLDSQQSFAIAHESELELDTAIASLSEVYASIDIDIEDDDTDVDADAAEADVEVEAGSNVDIEADTEADTELEAELDALINSYSESVTETQADAPDAVNKAKHNPRVYDKSYCATGSSLVARPNSRPTTNGCGPSYFGPGLEGLIRDALPASVTACCNQHDVDYSKCSVLRKAADDKLLTCLTSAVAG